MYFNVLSVGRDIRGLGNRRVRLGAGMILTSASGTMSTLPLALRRMVLLKYLSAWEKTGGWSLLLSMSGKEIH